MNVLYAINDSKLERRSSIDQHKDKFAIYSQGGWTPISFDSIDGIGCYGIKSHRSILSLDEDDLGYTFPEAYCDRPSDEYVLVDNAGVETEMLPEYYGDGTYEKYVDGAAIVNADNGALGSHNRGRERVGLDYYRTKDILPATA